MLSTAYMSSFCSKFIDKGIVRKKEETSWCKVINKTWNILTFHKNDDNFMLRTSTMCGHIYMYKGWEFSDKTLIPTYVCLKHEAMHLHDFKRLGPIIGLLIYFLFPLPVGLAYGRYWIERKAIVEELLAVSAVGGDTFTRMDQYILALSGWSYFFAWPFKSCMRRWFIRELLRRKNPTMTF